MKNVIISLIGVAGMAAAANAQTLAISVLFSTDGGATWSSDVTVNAGQVVQGSIWMSGTGNIAGMAGGTMRLNGTGLIAGESAAFGAGTDTGRVGPFNFGAATNAIFASAGAFRIDASSDAANSNTAAGLTFFQRDPASAAPGTFSSANPALCFRFDVSTAVGADHNISVALDQLSRGVATYYSATNASRPTSLAAALNGGTIRVVPTPATLALVGLGGLVATRRRTR